MSGKSIYDDVMLTKVNVAGVHIRRRESRAVVFNGDRKLIFKSTNIGANYHSAKNEGVIAVLDKLFKDFDIKSIDCLCLGVAGCDREKEVIELEDHLASYVKNSMVYNNGVIALVGASGKMLSEESAVLVEADTGAVAVGVNRKGELMRSGGWGYIIGDEGGAFDIGKSALIHAAKAHDGIETNSIDKEVVNFLSLRNFSDLIDLYDTSDPVSYVAALFPLVCELADKDKTAEVILEKGATALADLVKTLSKKLHIEGEAALYEEGRVFEDGNYRKRFESKLENFLTKQPKHGPEVGAAMLAFEKLTEKFKELE